MNQRPPTPHGWTLDPDFKPTKLIYVSDPAPLINWLARDYRGQCDVRHILLLSSALRD